MRTILFSLMVLGAAGCGGGDKPAGADGPDATDGTPTESAEPAGPFSLAWSEYPSWSAFGVAHELGIINGKAGELGEIEKKWNVDIELKEADYDSCITLYGSGQVDAAALTNMDALPAAATLKTVGILPTSTSFGADAVITTKDITDLKQLKERKVYGLALTVSEYTFARNLELVGENPDDYTFSNMDPAAAAIAMQQKQDGYEAITVWNPFVLETLSKREDVHVLADSTKIPGEIIDMVVVSQKSLDKPGGDAFAHAVIDTFYAINKRMADPATRDDTLVAIGEKFSNLELEAMKKVVEQTQFYSDADAGIAVFDAAKIDPIMKTVGDFELKREMVSTVPKVAVGTKESAADADFRFDASFMTAVKAKK